MGEEAYYLSGRRPSVDHSLVLPDLRRLEAILLLVQESEDIGRQLYK